MKEEKKLSTRSINYYNSVIRFIYDVVLDYPINQKQIPMLKGKRRLPKILSDEELDVFLMNNKQWLNRMKNNIKMRKQKKRWIVTVEDIYGKNIMKNTCFFIKRIIK